MKSAIIAIAAATVIVAASPAAAQVSAPRPAGRISFFVNASTSAGPESTHSSAELITSIAYGLPDRTEPGLEYGLDLRHSRPTSAERAARLSVYDSYVGMRLLDGTLRVRAGQMWITDLGALGSVSGGLMEYRHQRGTGPARLRVGAFGGIEPDTYEFGYVRGVRKIGGYAALEGAGGRRHVVGYTRVSHGGLTERSVVSFLNFLPLRSRVFVYQVGEYDLSGPGGQGRGGLTYFFTNARVSVTSRVEVQALFNRGRSVDARTITEDVLQGRAVSASALEGLLYESAGGRVTVTVLPRVRVHAGLTRDRSNRDSAATRRLSLGASAQNIAGSGLDVTVSDSLIDRPSGRYHSTYVSAGRQLGRSVYVSADYSSAVSIVRFTRADGLTVETRPETRQTGASAIVTLPGNFSLLVSGTRTTDEDTREIRVLAGLTYRLR